MPEGVHPDGHQRGHSARPAAHVRGQLSHARARLAPWIGALALGAIACDQAEPEPPSPGPPLEIVDAQPAPGAGLACEPGGDPSCGVPIDTVLRFRFNRYIQPATAVRQSFTLYLGSPDRGVFLEPEYDLQERVVTYRLFAGATLEPGVLYTVELQQPKEADDFGFRSFDGLPLSEGAVPLKYQFFTRADGGTDPEAEPGPAPDCDEVLELFRSAGCGTGGCHTSQESPDCPPGEARDFSSGQCVGIPRQGLRLDSAEAVAQTAINQVAHQTEVGPRADTPLENPLRFGVQMPIIDPGRPGNSYLMYKLLRKPENFVGADGDPCSSRYGLNAGGCLYDEAESTRLREWFVLLEPMPLGSASLASSNESARANVRLLQGWIAAGASLSDCF